MALFSEWDFCDRFLRPIALNMPSPMNYFDMYPAQINCLRSAEIMSQVQALLLKTRTQDLVVGECEILLLLVA
jgi:hypothetical protein